ncbi:MAG: hypothetical protein WD023_04780 [Ilumatobacteraceae bacterium]
MRLLRLAALIVGVAVLISPALRDRDSVPLSTYPVYSSVRPDVATFVTVHGERADGSIHRLSMDVIAQTDDPLIANSRLAGAVAAGRAEGVCAEIAERAPNDVIAVVVVRERHDVVAAARGEDSLLRRDELARCAVQP